MLDRFVKKKLLYMHLLVYCLYRGSNMRETKYTKDNLQKAVDQAKCLRDVAIFMNTNPRNGNLTYIGRQLKKLNIDYSHFPSMSKIPWNKGIKSNGFKTPISDFLVKNKYCGSHNLKKRLIKERILIAKCNKCNLEKWLDEKIPLELNHIDGNHTNNELSNLELLCPNCHAFTPHYRGKKLKSKMQAFGKVESRPGLHKDAIAKKLETMSMKEIAKELNCSTKSLYSFCIRQKLVIPGKHKKADYPELSILVKWVHDSNINRVAKELGISFNALKKYLKRRNAL